MIQEGQITLLNSLKLTKHSANLDLPLFSAKYPAHMTTG